MKKQVIFLIGLSALVSFSCNIDAQLHQIPIAVSGGLNNVTDSELDPCHLQNASLSGQSHCKLRSFKLKKYSNGHQSQTNSALYSAF